MVNIAMIGVGAISGIYIIDLFCGCSYLFCYMFFSCK